MKFLLWDFDITYGKPIVQRFYTTLNYCVSRLADLRIYGLAEKQDRKNVA